MTLILKLNFDNGIILVADKLATTAECDKVKRRKIFKINSNFYFGIATQNEFLIDVKNKLNKNNNSIEEIEKDIIKNFSKLRKRNIKYDLSFNEGDNINAELIKKIDEDISNTQIIIIGIEDGDIKAKLISRLGSLDISLYNKYIGSDFEYLNLFENFDTKNYNKEEVVKYAINLFGLIERLNTSIGDPVKVGLDIIILNKDNTIESGEIEEIEGLEEDIKFHFEYKWKKSNIKYKIVNLDEEIKPKIIKKDKLNSKDIFSILNSIKTDKDNFYNNENIMKILSNYDLTEEDWLLILSNLSMEEDIFRWLDIISFNLNKCIMNESLIRVLINIMKKLKNDMARGNFIEAIIELSGRDLHFSNKLFNEIIKIDNDFYVRQYSGYVLGGMGKIDFNNTLNFILNEWDKTSYRNQYRFQPAKIKALRIIFSDEKELREKEKIMEIMRKVSIQSGYFELMHEALLTNFELMRFDTTQFYENIKNLIKVDTKTKDITSQLRSLILDLVKVEKFLDENKELEILKECAKDDNEYVLNNLMLVLLDKYDKYPNEVIDIILFLVKRGFFIAKIRNFDYIFKEIIKKDKDRVISILNNFVENEKNVSSLNILNIVLNFVGIHNNEFININQKINNKLKVMLQEKIEDIK